MFLYYHWFLRVRFFQREIVSTKAVSERLVQAGPQVTRIHCGLHEEPARLSNSQKHGISIY